MINLSRILGLIAFACATTAFLPGCSDSSSDSDPNNPGTRTLERIEITPSEQQIALGTSARYAATAVYDDGSSEDVTDQATWTSSDPQVVTMDASADNRGVATSVGVGQTTITATLDTLSDSATVTVVEADVVAINITPESPVMGVGTALQLNATANFSDGSSQDLTDQVSWQSSAPDVVTVDVNGQAVSVAPGSSTITATFAEVPGTATLVVTDAALVQIDILPDNPVVAPGAGLQLSAVGRYEDGVSQDLTTLVTWSATPTGIVDIDSTDEPGQAIGVAEGEATVSAAFETVTGSEILTVSGAPLDRLELTMAASSLAKGTATQIHATAIYGDARIQDVTDQATWTSSAPDTLSISNAEGAEGIAQGLQEGSGVITAEFGQRSVSATLTVTAATLMAIQINPAEAAIARDVSLVLTAIGHFSDGSTQDLSRWATWSSTDKDVVTVSNGIETKGIATAQVPGDALITASFSGVPATMPIQVTDATLVTLSIEPATATIAAETRIGLRAVGQYTDGSVADLTRQVNWSSSQETIVQVSNTPGAQGEVSGIGAGAGEILASFPDTATPASATIQVTDTTLESITVMPVDGSVPAGGNIQFNATGGFSDGSEQDLTALVIWEVSANNIARISNAAGSQGQVAAIGVGTTNVTARLADTSASAELVVSDDPAAPVSLALLASPNVILNNGADTATIRAVIKPAGDATVADGTVVQFDVEQGGAVLSSPTASTVNGEATISLTSTDAGTIAIGATVEGTGITQRITVSATPDLSTALNAGTFHAVAFTDGLVAAGARFGSFISNLSNRTFGLDSYQLLNGEEVIISRTDPSVLSGNDLKAGEGTGIVVRTTQDQPDSGFVARYDLSDPITDQALSVELPYELGSATTP